MIHSAMAIASMRSKLEKVYVVYDNIGVFAVFRKEKDAYNYAEKAKKDKGLAGHNDSRVFLCERVIR